MKPLDQLKFEEFPINVPNEKKVIKKLSSFVEQLKQADSAAKYIAIYKKAHKYMDALSTDMGVISIRYSLETNNPEIKAAQDKCDEISPLISNVATQFEKMFVESPFRPELEKKFGTYLFKMYEANLKSFDEKIIPELIQEN